MTDKMTRQIALEHEMTSAGVARYEATVANARAELRESGTPSGTRLLQAAVEPLSVALQGFMDASRKGRPGPASTASVYLDGMDLKVVSYITARVILDRVGGSSQLQSVAISVANYIEDEARFVAFETLDKEKYDVTQRHLKDTTHLRHRKKVLVYQMNKNEVAWEAWSETKKLQLGVRLIELFVEGTGLVAVEAQDRGRYRVVATAETMKWLEESNARHAVMCPVYMPCLIPPKPWTSPLSGGYHTKGVRRMSLVKTKSKGFIDELFASDLSQVYSAINALQDTAWRINTAVLAVARTMWDAGEGLGKVLPSRDSVETPPKPLWLSEKGEDGKLTDLTEEQRVEFKEWKQQAAESHKAHAKSISRRLQTARIIAIADRFAPEEEIYYPHSLDFRGRVYAQPPFLNPQGNDLSKGLLTFAKGKPIGDAAAPGWLAIHGANVYGYDKTSLEERIEWVTDNQGAILACAAAPLEEAFWQDASSPWMFLAFCFEWAGYVREGATFVSSLPVALDGSCNGIQHFSAMLRDPVGGAAVNLTPSATPSDIYGRVAEVTTAQLRLNLSTGAEDAHLFAQAWLTFGITRKETKRSVMVLPYGGTYMSCKDYVEEAVRERGIETLPWTADRKLMNKALHYLAKAVWKAIGEVVVGARVVMAWLQACTRLAAKTGLPINWPTASGLWVQQAYKKSKLRKTEIRIFGQRVDLTLTVDGTEIDKVKQVLGVPPNFVHSQDAAALMACVNTSTENGITSFAMVHDSYGTLAADTDMLAACLRHAFVDLYKEHDVLEEFRASVVGMLTPEEGEKVPRCPQKGDLDLDAVLSSDFFFA